MNQLVDPQALMSAIPLPAPGMTRYEKLMHWARIVRNYHCDLLLMHGLENYDGYHLKEPAFHIKTLGPITAFGLAMSDQVFVDAGLKSSVLDRHENTGSIADIMGFMELTQAQLHEFSCDCGGAISNTDMADRIERLA